MSTTSTESLIAQGNPTPKKWTVSRILFGVVAVSSVLVGIASYRYLIGVAVLENIAANTYYNPVLPIHAASAATALIAGPIQFVASARRRYPRAHRIVGRLYGVSCIIGGVSGIVLAAGASTGPIASAGFAALGTLWLICTVQAWQLAFNRRIAEHRRWMIRSFALTFAAVTLRLYIPIFLNMGIKFDPAYRAISWLCWVPNILLVEAYLAKTKTKVAPNIQSVTQSTALPSDSMDKQQASHATSTE